MDDDTFFLFETKLKVSIPVQVPMVPMPSKPLLHEQLKLPAGTFEQSAFVSQLCVASTHSSISGKIQNHFHIPLI